MPECPECGSPPAPGRTTCAECGVSLPWWEMAASSYVTTLQPDYDADWSDKGSVTATVRAPSLSFETKTFAAPQPHTAPVAEEPPRGEPQHPAPEVNPARGATVAEQDDTWKEPTPGGERAPLWTPADAPPRFQPGVDAQMPWRTLIALLVLAVLAGAAYLVYPRAEDWWAGRSVPAALRAYIGGDGVPYSPVGEGYSVRLPERPIHRDVPRSSLPGPWVALHRSAVSGDDYQIVVRVAEISRGGELPFGAAGALGDPQIAGAVAPTVTREVAFAGVPAFEFEGEGARDTPVRGRIFVRGTRVYVVTVDSAGADDVFDELMRSFTLDAE